MKNNFECVKNNLMHLETPLKFREIGHGPQNKREKKRGQFYNIDQIILHNGSNRRSWSNLSKLILYLTKKKVGKKEKEKEKDDVDSEKLI